MSETILDTVCRLDEWGVPLRELRVVDLIADTDFTFGHYRVTVGHSYLSLWRKEGVRTIREQNLIISYRYSLCLTYNHKPEQMPALAGRIL